MNSMKNVLLIAAVLTLPLTTSADTRELFNGKDLIDWTHVGAAGLGR